MTASFVEVTVAPHPALPAGFCGRWKQAGAATEVTEVYYAPDEGPDGLFLVQAVGSDGRRRAALQVAVEDSAAGLSLLVLGGDFGLRLWRQGGPEWAEPYLLLAEEP